MQAQTATIKRKKQRTKNKKITTTNKANQNNNQWQQQQQQQHTFGLLDVSRKHRTLLGDKLVHQDFAVITANQQITFLLASERLQLFHGLGTGLGREDGFLLLWWRGERKEEKEGEKGQKAPT